MTSKLHLDRAPDDGLRRAVIGVVHQGDLAVSRIALLATELERERVAAVAVEAGEILGEKPPLVLTFTTGGNHQHVVAKRFSKGIDRLGHDCDLEQNKNIVKCAHDHETLLPLVFKAFCKGAEPRGRGISLGG